MIERHGLAIHNLYPGDGAVCCWRKDNGQRRPCVRDKKVRKMRVIINVSSEVSVLLTLKKSFVVAE